MFPSFLVNGDKTKCYGCEACKQICNLSAISFIVDDEGFKYPAVNKSLCVNCGLCSKVCPFDNDIFVNEEKKEVFGGYIINKEERVRSTSGEAFTAICKAFFDNNTVIFGSKADGCYAFHEEISSLENLDQLRKSKYSQSAIGDSLRKVKDFLIHGKKVLFSGTPCQIAALNLFLGKINKERLLTIEVVCEGVPSPLYINKYLTHIEKRYNKKVIAFDYRSKESSINKNVFKWDFEVEKITFEDGSYKLTDRWFNPFWQIWLKHLMSRPSCYHCKYARIERTADITLGDLWGVHLYCPELYGDNGGSSLVICNTDKGKSVFDVAKTYMYGHELDFNEAIKYQSPLRKHIEYNDKRHLFMADLESTMSYKDIVKKWYKRPNLKLLFSKYVWGNRQKIRLWERKRKKA